MCIYTHIHTEILVYNSTFSFQYWLKKVISIKEKKKKKNKKEVPKLASQPTADTATKQQVSRQPPYRFPLVLLQQSTALQSIVSPSQAVFSLGKCGLLFSIWFSFYKTSVNQQAMRQTYTIHKHKTKSSGSDRTYQMSKKRNQITRYKITCRGLNFNAKKLIQKIHTNT